MNFWLRFFSHTILIIGVAACQKSNPAQGNKKNAATKLFTLLPSGHTGVDFRNDLTNDESFNIINYRNFYNGGGVAVGDINRDGLPDLFFTSNMGQNKLYLNRGEMRFEDVTEIAQVGGKGSWSTGVTMADVNGDGWLDIYVCNSGNPRKGQNHEAFYRGNELFINGGDTGGERQIPVFTEKAKEFGLDDKGLGTHAAFFDYDRDGDLDVYVLNNSFRSINSFNLDLNLRHTRDPFGGHKLYKNDNGKFHDASLEAGILGSEIAFGLGVTVGDVDLDGWPDIYVSNDFFERDYFYRNLGNGKFKEELENRFRHISQNSMGADMADLNNDIFPEIFVTDMLPKEDSRIKTITQFNTWDRHQYLKRSGYFSQFTRNMLHLNNSDGTFSEIGCLSGTEATDWSWGALLFDMDNDGWKDIFVANGVAKDISDQDYLSFFADAAVQKELKNGGNQIYKRLIDTIPSQKIANFAFRNNRDLSFSDVSEAWGLAQNSFSNGSAFGDLDNDGDMDLVVNNVNSEAFVFQNETGNFLKTNNFLKVELHGEGKNTAAIGAKVFVRAEGKNFYLENFPARGFQSSVDGRPNFGLGEISKIDTLLVVFPSDKSVMLRDVPANQFIKISESQANRNGFPEEWKNLPVNQLFSNITETFSMSYKHRENDFLDWDRDKMLLFSVSKEGPRMASTDVNSDGLADVFFCGSAGFPGSLFLQIPGGKFHETKQTSFENDKNCEDSDAVFFDADGDGDQDLAVASGGNEFLPGSEELVSRLYLNDGKGHFLRKPDAFPFQNNFACGVVKSADFDSDGDWDLFFGMRLLPGKIGVPVSGILLLNDGKGQFQASNQPVLKNLGMLTDACFSDFDNDQKPDLAIVGEWMPLKILLNKNGKLEDADTSAAMRKTAGLWKRIVPADFNNDSLLDFVVGNFGLNSRLKATPEQPNCLFFNDFDKNGTTEQVLCRFHNGRLLPYHSRGDFLAGVPVLRKRYMTHHSFANQEISDIFSPEQLLETIKLNAGELASGILMNLGNGKFSFHRLPNEAQFSPIFSLCTGDFDGDGNSDIVSGGNFYAAKPEFGQMDADFGLFLKGDGKGGFRPLRSAKSGLRFDGEVRDILKLKIDGRQVLLVSRNSDSPLIFGF